MIFKPTVLFLSLAGCALSGGGSYKQKLANVDLFPQNFKQATFSAPSSFGSVDTLFKALWGSKKARKHPIFSKFYTSFEGSSDLYSQKRLIQTSPDSPPVQLSEEEIHTLRRMGIKFMDITDTNDYTPVAVSTKPYVPFPTTLIQQKSVGAMSSQLSTNFTRATLEKFTSFTTRYYNSETGRDAAFWLKDQIQSIIDHAPEKNIASVRTFDHRFAQPSVIARFEGSGESKSQLIIVTAHLDSINSWIPWYGRAPGADDNGSGTVTILDAFRVLVANGFKPSKTVEFHWYAGEEGGLLGSQDVSKTYNQNGVNMLGQLHYDMTGFFEGPEVFGLVMDNVNNDMVDFLRLMVSEYTRLKPGYLKCGYACSDHASWNKLGYRSVMAYESESLTQNKNIHTPRDSVETISFDHILEFSKVAIAYCVEYGL